MSLSSCYRVRPVALVIQEQRRNRQVLHVNIIMAETLNILWHYRIAWKWLFIALYQREFKLILQLFFPIQSSKVNIPIWHCDKIGII